MAEPVGAKGPVARRMMTNQTTKATAQASSTLIWYTDASS